MVDLEDYFRRWRFNHVTTVERVIGPDSTILIHYMLRKMTKMMDGLMVYPDNMMRNLEKTGGLIYSQSVLLALVRKGITREETLRRVHLGGETFRR